MRNYVTISKNLLKVFCNFQTQPFLFPVNSKVVPDYHRIVKKPMDLQSIREVRYTANCERIQYNTIFISLRFRLTEKYLRGITSYSFNSVWTVRILL